MQHLKFIFGGACAILGGLINIHVAGAGVAQTPLPTYVAVPLGTLGGINSEPRALNARGDVTGLAYLHGDQVFHAFLYSDGAMRDLGAPNGDISIGTGINDSDQVALVSAFQSPPLQPCCKWHAFRYSDERMLPLMFALDPDAETHVTGINNNGWISGYFFGSGVVWTNPRILYVGGLSGSTARAVNTAGDVAGSMFLDYPSVDVSHAFIYKADGVLDNLGAFDGGSSYAFALNDNGDVTGYGTLLDAGSGASITHAFLYSRNAMRDLGPLDGTYQNTIGEGINDSGVVVGRASVLHGASSRAFIYVNGGMHDLTSLAASGLGSAVLFDAYAINNRGQIVAQGCGGIGNCQAFRLDPVASIGIPPRPVEVVEYYYPASDHYFMTSIPGEVQALDSGQFPGWQRTGESFAAYPAATVGAEAVCRLYNDGFTPSSHFYSADPNECLFTRNNPGWTWQLEGTVFYIPVPDANGVCRAGTAPVYRLYNNGEGGAPNHRYTTSNATHSQMLARGWTAEGHGPDAVIMCAPSS